MIDLVEHVSQRLTALAGPGEPLVLAVSGGCDSIVMLDLVCRGSAPHTHRLFVAHIDHGISPESGEVAGIVARAATARRVPFAVQTLALGAQASETQARRARRAVLRQIADRAGARFIALAHHADDQAETVLLRVLRGSGPDGLAAMAPRAGRWLRPLLDVTAADLRAEATRRGLEWWEDPANRDPRHLRSWLRTTVIPLVAARLPDIRPALVRAAGHARSARTAWDAVPASLEGLDVTSSDYAISVAVAKLIRYGSPLRAAVLRACARRVGLQLGARRIRAVERLINSGAGVVDVSAHHVAELHRGRLTFRRRGDSVPSIGLEASGTTRWGNFSFDTSVAAGECCGRSGWSTSLAPGRYTVRGWRAGDRIRPLGGTGSRAAAVLMREAEIAAGRRPRVPVIVAEDATIVWIPGICRGDGWLPAQGNEALHVDCVVR